MAPMTSHVLITFVTVVFLFDKSKAGFFNDVLNVVAPKKVMQVKDWHMEDCDDGSQLLQLKHFHVSSNEHGSVRLSGQLAAHTHLNSPVSVKVAMERKVLGIWLAVPCVKDFGSCTYEDLCSYGYSELEACPAEFKRLSTPCRCPVQMGVYDIPEDLSISVPSTHWGRIAKGNYRAKVHAYHHHEPLGCFKTTFTLKAI